MKKRKVDLFKPNEFTNEWIVELRKTFKSGMIAQAGKVEEFEKEFENLIHSGKDSAVALNSGTAALEMAYHLVDIQPGDKVLTVILTCSATNIPLVHRKADIHFVDIDPISMCMDYEDFENKVDRKTKAVVVVNLGGNWSDVRIFEKAKELEIPVIIDAAQQLGAWEWHGDYVCYSFQAIKHFSTGDGGMIIVRNQDDYERVKKLRWFGIDRDRRRKMNFEFSPSDREMCMNMDEPGFKKNMNDIQATMGLVGIKHSDEALHHRQKIAQVYMEAFLGKIKYVAGGSYWLFAIMLKDRDSKLDKIKEAGVGVDLVHLRNDIFTPFGSKRLDLPNMNLIESEYLYIPIHSKMGLADARYVAKVILENI